MEIRWLGHACFKITNDKNISIITDPFDNSTGYKLPETYADIVTVSHDHFDHNYVDAIKGDYKLVNKIGVFNVKDTDIWGIASHHDKFEGQKRGNNIIYKFNIDGIYVCHLGDLGHVLNDEQLSKIGKVDVLLIPVGGFYTIDADEAVAVINQINPKIVIPMHYKTKASAVPHIDSVDVFIEKIGGADKLQSQIIKINKEDLSVNRKTYILNYE